MSCSVSLAYFALFLASYAVVTVKALEKENVIYTTATGVISSRGYPDTNYLSYSVDTYTIRAPSLKPITLTFTILEIEDDYDFLTIYRDGTQLTRLTGFTIPDPIKIDAQEVKLELKTDGTGNYRGFSLNYRFPVDCQADCKDLCFETFEGHVCGCASGFLETDMITCGPIQPVGPPTNPLNICKMGFLKFLHHHKKCGPVKSKYTNWSLRHRRHRKH